MKAVTYNPTTPNGVAFDEVAEPVAQPEQAVVTISAFSMNFADVAFLDQRFKPGEVIGFEAAGTVVQPAADGTGPPLGARVVGFAPKGGWAERRAIKASELTTVPDELDLGVAAALPVAGVTALRALRRLDTVLGRRVLVTGASGGVGHLAVQLAARAGAHVIACVGDPQRGEGLLDLGACEIVGDLEEIEPVYGVLELVGGALLGQAYAHLERYGRVVSIGMASLEATTIDFETARVRSGGSTIEAYDVFAYGASLAEDTALILDLAQRGDLAPTIGWRGDWLRIDEAIAAFRGRQVRGKAVVDVA